MKSGFAAPAAFALCACAGLRGRSDEAANPLAAVALDLQSARTADAALWNAQRGTPSELRALATAAIAATTELEGAIAREDETERWVALRGYAQLARRAAAQTAGTTDAATTRSLQRALRRLEWIELAARARLGLDAGLAEWLAARPELTRPDGAPRELAELDLAPRVQAWVLVTLFRATRARDDEIAKRFACAALDRAPEHAGELRELATWLESGSGSRFHCPKCDHALVADLRACPNDSTPNAEFVGRPRAR